MEGLILAAGEGSRIGELTSGIPKVFINVHGRSLYERHLDSLVRFCDRITIVLGYGFVGSSPGEYETREKTGTFDGEIIIADHRPIDRDTTVDENRVRAFLASEHDIEITAVILPYWDSVDNAESCRVGLEQTERDVLLLNGDIVYRDTALHALVGEYGRQYRDRSLSVVGVIPGIQDDMTAVRWDGEGRINAYGAIAGHQVAGMFVVNKDYIREFCAYLESRPSEWFPVAFPEIPSTFVPIPPESQYEINTPAHLKEARKGVARWEESLDPIRRA